MIVALDARMQQGVGAVVRNVALRVAPKIDKLILLGNPAEIETWGTLKGTVEVVPFLAPIYGLQEQLTFPVARLRGCNLLHVPHFNIPMRAVPCPLICSIHDVAHLAGVLPISRGYRLVARWYYWHAARRSRHIITGSEFSKREIVERLAVDPSRVTVIPYGVDTQVFYPRRESEIAAVHSALGVRRPYILVLGSLRPHKNVRRVLEAFRKLKERGDIPHQLVVVGKQEGFRITEELPILPPEIALHVVFTGFLGEKETAALYSGADLFLFASLYEGFGLPPLEAMACGAPVAVSRAASLPEVVAEAGAYFDPYSVDEIAETALKILRDPAGRDRLVRAGRERVTQLTWERSAEGHLEVYKKYAR
jgi:glycosyltransferase involved in cell wall biosynthesis